jgi:aminopeptidase N
MKVLGLLIHSWIAVLVVAAPEASPSVDPKRFAGDRPMDMKHIALDFRVDVPRKQVQGSAALDLVALREVASIRLDAVDFAVSAITVARDGQEAAPADYQNDGKSIEVFLGEALTEGSKAKVTIQYALADPKSGLHFFGPSAAEPDVPYVVWSQGETTDNRYWFPCFDHPNEMQTTEMTVTVADGNEALSNGRLLSKTDNPDNTTTFHWLQDKPHVACLVTLVVGEFYVEQDAWRGKPVLYYAPPKQKADVRRSMGNTVRMIEHFSNLTGVEYPWGKYAQVCVEGMENTSATTLGPRALHDERAHLDISSDGLIAHELAHQWFGDLVTCKEWAHTWLNEGFATFFSAVWFEHDLGADEYDYEIYDDMRSAIEGGKKAPVVDRRYEDEGDMFDRRAYPKGASILHMLRRQLGDERFWAAVNRYLTRHAHDTVETADLRQAFEDETGWSLERFFYDWTERPGAPAVSVSYEWVERDKLARVAVKQTQEAAPFNFPIQVEFHLDTGEPVMLRGEITEKEQRFYLPLPDRPKMVLVDPQQAVLMELSEQKGRDLWREQLKNGPRVVDRIRAAKNLGESKNDEDTALLGDALASEKFWGVGEVIAESIGKAGGDKGRDVLLANAAIPHPKIRREVMAQLGSFHRDEKAAATLRGIVTKGDASYRVEAAAIEAYAKLQPDDAGKVLPTLLDRPSHGEQIRVAALSGLGKQPDAAGLETILQWSRRGKPRECRQAAVRALGELAKNVHLPEPTLQRIVDTLLESLEGEQRRMQQSVITVLRDLGNDARPALPVLRALANNDPSERVRKAAKEAVDKITAAAPEQTQVKELREELAKLREEAKDLKKRLEKLEARPSKGDQVAGD